MKEWARPLAFTVALYTGLIWGYVVLRILTLNDAACWSTQFIDGIPVTFWQLGIVAFIASAAGLYYTLKLTE